MDANRLLRRRGAVLAAAASAVALAAGVSLSTPALAQGSDTSSIVYQVHPFAQKYNGPSAKGAFPSPSQCVAAYGIACYTPSEIRQAYDIPDSWTGAGQSIAIIDAYGSPTVQSDLDTFDQAFGIPDTTVNVVCPQGCPSSMTAHQGQPGGWAGETSLDVQWAHAIAPGAKITLVVAANNYGNALNNAVQYAVDHKLGDVISMSYGADEAAISGGGNNMQLDQSEAIFQQAVNAGISLFASSGDYGASDGGSTPTASYPASSPEVTAVGGTDLFTSKRGGYDHETVWNDTDPATCPFGCTGGVYGATGGAYSTIFPAPSYQANLTGQSQRSPSDVAYNASVYTSVLVYMGFNSDAADNGFYFMGGTSSGSPQWAAIGALANAQAGGTLTTGDSTFTKKLYALAGTSAFNDVTVGNNDWYSAPGYTATTGYDVPTGLGSPDVKNLVSAIAGGSSGGGSSSHGRR